MSTTEQRLAANRANALQSKGPVTAYGKAVASQNATRHGFFSSRLILDGEDPAEFAALTVELQQALNPVGAIEIALVERIAVTIWRQRRLVRAETAGLELSIQPRRVALTVSDEIGRNHHEHLSPEDLEEFDESAREWAQSVTEEIEGLDEISLRSVAENAPLAFAQLQTDAEDEGGPEAFLASHDGGLTSYISELLDWCRNCLREAEKRPQILALAEQVRRSNLVLPRETLELFARYQTTLDNQLYKALKALREAQDWRMRTLEPIDSGNGADLVHPIDAAA